MDNASPMMYQVKCHVGLNDRVQRSGHEQPPPRSYCYSSFFKKGKV